MPSNALATAIDHGKSPSDDGRLPVRSAALGIFALSLFGWVAVLAPLIAFLHR